MYPYIETDQDYIPSEDIDTQRSFSYSTPGSDQCVPPSPPPKISTGQSFPPASHHQSVSSQTSLGQNVQPPDASLPLPAFTPTPSWGLTQDSLSTPNPYLPVDDNPPHQVTVDVPSPDLQPSPFSPQCSEECPELECSVCFSQFNNVFRCPKMLHCKHTFCLECLARINVKSAEPNAILCPLCRGLTPLPTHGLPKLTTDSDVLSYLPAAMQRVYSIRFIRNKGKLQVKRAPERGRSSVTSLGPTNRTLNVGLPSSTAQGSEARGVDGMVLRMTGRPVCRALFLVFVVVIIVVLTAVVIHLLSKPN
ncbi:E3 ubiquitin-protein ligase RNF183 [Oryzias melastigma]|uniref:Probable E3 ubiquitin-protein ligase RNF183 n=1 Tax=Oryzias melastigma TaxID=30732 RepID=A0A3B3BBZ1_ORYME|nr:E3 ubiquitin-protein ligase RNF183 [Oryzias melastigma]XP_024115965.1 E3 ubiquitin-protein ligase RNF183 [Oryzias melastigma]XP_024115966.1 E3 ubiquitin-protein ligase RNF183 [Oryzias melastigma]XP_036069652.1 E3 ubiquitin-protein ligase RNF183 [Oryzias melastigma]